MIPTLIFILILPKNRRHVIDTDILLLLSTSTQDGTGENKGAKVGDRDNQTYRQ